jgi:hypothetical protein
MQLTLALLDPPNQPRGRSVQRRAPPPWDQLDQASREAALQILARLIARMLAAKAGEGGER